MKYLLRLLAAAASLAGAQQAPAATVTKHFSITALGFEASAPVAAVTGKFSYTYNDQAFLTPPAAVGLSDFNLPGAGTPLFSFNKGNDVLVTGTNIGLVSFTVSPAVPGFGFFLQHPGGTPLINSFVYSLGTGAIYHSSRVNIVDLDAVPEPATWALMLAGFGLVGGLIRRRSTARRVFA
ncbi:hypothetical protein SCH01S_03_00480 [Sphingomonas changbaiensis NBRC 104936]|uniref:Ice-binding protein C-terminal domain-containing protein n=1 Tax=Sphingomonas changbaiensis NBRC 104936 TaxID=1219043 RepID=A0A0E9MKL2_9SPHN|nr:PEPxxWA-CTERM sorting domain-containing protein [Sphingomonas changbaiensis]GAO38074.1 hypothetical protein SCH01S_03_00480 [Sphingomonas changbaiensis NBRC 104936]